jgi:phospholipid/cholesterol/gamma-HCH transport system ATP-binding protein
MKERNAIIELVNVSKTFGNKKVLDGINLKVYEGETLVIIGRSGTGKSVTLKHIMGILDPDYGEVYVFGKRMSYASMKERNKLRMKMGVLFQSGALINWLSVWENVALPLKEHRIYKKKEIEKIVEKNLKLLDLWDARDLMPANISGGMKKRVGLARALVLNPKIILYDEPTSGLDPIMSNVINTLIMKLQREFGVTSVVVTHDISSAYMIADRIAMLYEGKIIECNPPEKIKHTTNPIVRQFIEGNIKGPMMTEEEEVIEAKERNEK